MNISLAQLDPVPAFALPAWWTVTAVIAAGLPRSRTARTLRRRSIVVTALTATGVLALLASLLTPAVQWSLPAHPALLAGPGAVVALVCLPRLRRLQASAQAFSTVPAIPAAPSMRAAAAHPLIVGPLLAMAGAAAAGTGLGAGVDELTAIGALVVAVVLIAAGTAIRHAALVPPAAPAWIGLPHPRVGAGPVG